MTDLDSLIKRSLAEASPHSRKVFSQNPMTAQEVLDLANGRVLFLAATVKPSRKPHLSPTDLITLEGRFYVGVDEATARHKNLKHNPAITIMMAEGWKRQAILEGEARFLDMKGQEATGVLEAQKKRYGWTSEALAEIVPQKIFTWKAPPKG